MTLEGSPRQNTLSKNQVQTLKSGKYIMAKIMFQDNTMESKNNQGRTITAKSISSLMGTKFQEGEILVLVPGSQYVETYNGHDYVAHKVLVFSAEGDPQTVELLAKSQHSFTHYGSGDKDMPVCQARLSQAQRLVPDAAIEEVQSPFRFKIVTKGTSPSGEDLCDAVVERPQYVKVLGRTTYWFPQYKDGDVVTDDNEKCVFGRRRKYVFEKWTPTDKVESLVKAYLPL